MNKDQAKRNAFLPLIGMIIMYTLLIYYGIFSKGPHSYADDFMMLIAILSAIIVPIYTFVVMIQFIIFVTKLPDISEGKKVFWGIMMYLFNAFVFPIFWHIHMKNREFNYHEWEVARNSQRQNPTTSQAPYYTRNAVYRSDITGNTEGKVSDRNDTVRDNNTLAAVLAFVPICMVTIVIFISEFQGNFLGVISREFYEFVENVSLWVVFLWVVSGLAAYILYVYLIIHNEQFNRGRKIMWIIALTVCHIFIFPVYWDMYIRKKRDEDIFWTIMPLLLFITYFLWPIPALKDHLENMLRYWFLFVTLVIYIIVILKYIMLVWENIQLHIVKRIIWSVCFVVLGMVMCPIYWKRHICIKNEGGK